MPMRLSCTLLSLYLLLLPEFPSSRGVHQPPVWLGRCTRRHPVCTDECKWRRQLTQRLSPWVRMETRLSHHQNWMGVLGTGFQFPCNIVHRNAVAEHQHTVFLKSLVCPAPSSPAPPGFFRVTNIYMIFSFLFHRDCQTFSEPFPQKV